jgi:hypothetical protein
MIVTRMRGEIALPVRRPAAPAYASLFDESAAVVFIRRRPSRFYEIGRLVANDKAARDDNCPASCVDWYGNSRPIFIQERILALMGYEIVAGAVEDGRIHEVDRASFAPNTSVALKY